MGVFNKFKDLMGFEEYEDEEELEEEEEYEKNNSYYDRKPVEPRTQTTTSPRYDSGNVPYYITAQTCYLRRAADYSDTFRRSAYPA